MREQADAAALKNVQARGELVPAIDVKREWSGVLRTMGAAMLAVPSRIQSRLGHLTADDVSEIDREVRDALAETAEGNADAGCHPRKRDENALAFAPAFAVELD